MRWFPDIKISETMLIALTPFFGYIAAFFFSIGRYYVLEVPFEYIQISLELVLLASVLTFSFSLVVIVTWMLLDKLFPSRRKGQTKYLLNGNPISKTTFKEAVILTILLPLVIAGALFFSTTLPLLYVSSALIGLLVLIAGLFFLPPLTRYPEIKNYMEKFEKYSDDDYERKIELAREQMKRKSTRISRFSINSLLGIDPENTLYRYILLTIYAIIWASLAFVIGTAMMRTSTYSITNLNMKDYIVLGVYSEKYILVGVDKKKRTTTNEILLLNLEKELKITSQYIGIVNEPKRVGRFK